MTPGHTAAAPTGPASGTASGVFGARAAVDLRFVRAAGVGMAAIGAAWPLLPHPASCILFATTGVPCPLCGSTRAVVAAVRGDLGASLRYSPMGLLVVALVLASFFAWRRRIVTIPTWPIVAVLAAMFAYNVGFNPTFA